MEEYEHVGIMIFESEYGDYNSSEYGSGEPDVYLAEPCDRTHSTDFQRIFLPTVYGIIFVLGTVGNGLVVGVMGFQKKSRNMTDKYRLHLSVADLLFVLTLPFWAVDAASSWYFGHFLCVAVHMIYTVNLYSSVLILAFISLDRYLAVVRNSQVSRKLLAERVIYVGVWLPAALLTVPDLVFAKATAVGNGTVCGRIYPQGSGSLWTAIFHIQHIFVGFIIPGLIILTCYCIIISKLISKSEVSKVKAQGQLKRRALKTTVILILCFFSCWLPYCTGILVDTLMTLNVIPHSCALERSLVTWITITEALAYFHCCLNPILYAFLGAKFKKSARSTFATSQGSSLKMLAKKKRAGLSSVSTESESSGFQSS